MSTALVIVNDVAHKRKITQYLEKNRNLSIQFPQNLRESLELSRTLKPALIIILLNNAKDTAIKLCNQLKHQAKTNHIPVLLIQSQDSAQQEQIADAHLQQSFNEREFDQIIRQLTMGY